MRYFWEILKKLRKLVLYKVLKLKTRGVRIIITDSRQVFLIKHPYDNFWVLPGGGVKKNESIFEAAKREAEEEVGMIPEGDLTKVGKYTNNTGGKDDQVYVVACHKWSDSHKKKSLMDKIEVQKTGWFSLDDLPRVSKPTAKRLDEYRNGDYSDEFRVW